MGFQDRDYYREGSQSIYVTSMVVKLIIINGIVFLAELLFGGDARGNHVASWLGAHADTIVRPLYWWQFLTAGFVHDPDHLNHILFNMLGLYCFGMPLEERYGRREFLRFYLTAVVLGFIVWSASNYFLVPQTGRDFQCFGASGGVTAATLLFCLLYPRATLLAAFIFPVPAWLVGAVIIVHNLFGITSASPLMGGVAYDVHLVGAALALGYWYFGWNFGRLPGLAGLTRMLKAPQKWLKAKPPLKVHDPEHYYEDLDAQADRLLDKVAHDGLGSLTDAERRILEDYSRRTRQKLR
ncbi:MAG TPA: rhomboid family intramembrane serine protease [Pirellulaceae bacterium]|nr:rhomboid family intramembrane serine protease [Pirellulaceae bacterium]